MSSKEKSLDKQEIKVQALLPADFSFTITQIKTDFFKKGKRVRGAEIIADALNVYFKEMGYPEIK